MNAIDEENLVTEIIKWFGTEMSQGRYVDPKTLTKTGDSPLSVKRVVSPMTLRRPH